jgi:hypothetical protein
VEVGRVICSPATEGWDRSEWSGEREKVLPKNFRDFRLELNLVPSPVGERSVSSKEQAGAAQFLALPGGVDEIGFLFVDPDWKVEELFLL